MNSKPLTDNEFQAVQQQHIEQAKQHERARLRAEALIQKIGQAYDELTRLMQQFPEIGPQVTQGCGEEHSSEQAKGREFYEQVRRQNLELADAAPRCRWVKQDGTLCRAPGMKNHIYCFAHMQMMEARTLALRLPAAEDANAIQIGLMQVQKALIEDRISTKKAGLLLYSMQLALQNVGQVTFGQAKDEEMLTEGVTEEEAFSSQEIGSSGDRDIPPQSAQNRRGPGTPDIRSSERQIFFMAEDAKIAEEDKGLPNIHGRQVKTDETDLGKRLPVSEWDAFLEKLPRAARAAETRSGAFGARSSALRISPAG